MTSRPLQRARRATPTLLLLLLLPATGLFSSLVMIYWILPTYREIAHDFDAQLSPTAAWLFNNGDTYAVLCVVVFSICAISTPITRSAGGRTLINLIAMFLTFGAVALALLVVFNTVAT